MNASFPRLQIPPNSIEQILAILDWEICADGRAEKAAVVVHDAEAVINQRLDLVKEYEVLLGEAFRVPSSYAVNVDLRERRLKNICSWAIPKNLPEVASLNP